MLMWHFNSRRCLFTNLFVCIFWRTDKRKEKNWQLCVAGLFSQYLGQLHSPKSIQIGRAAKKAFECRLTVTLIDTMTSHIRRNISALILGQLGEHFSSHLEESEALLHGEETEKDWRGNTVFWIGLKQGIGSGPVQNSFVNSRMLSV